MRQVRTFQCQPCSMTIELADEREDDRFAAMVQLHNCYTVWRSDPALE